MSPDHSPGRYKFIGRPTTNNLKRTGAAGKLAEAQAAQVELLRKQRELDDAKREIELTVEKRVQESLVVIRDKAKLEAAEELKLKLAEREEKIASMQRQID
jgi:hypothetical protein